MQTTYFKVWLAGSYNMYYRLFFLSLLLSLCDEANYKKINLKFNNVFNVMKCNVK